MVAAEVEPSPQVMVAPYSAAVAEVSGSVKVATGPVKTVPSTGEAAAPVTVIAASTGFTQCTTAVACCLEPPESVKVAVMVSSPTPLRSP